ncbi:MAG TPA: SRPBCC family protein [Candidatus Polarisedimenticolaceae bacterium]|nr:SRPBCC family protein [Candidatus Polarisedimenticolaceae bacterium]
MQLLLVVMLLIALAAGAVWAWGGREQTFRARIRIEATPEAVFRWLTEPPLLARWIGGFVESRPLGDGRIRVGARSTEVIEERGRRTELQSEIVALDPGRRLAVRLSSPFLTAENAFTLDASDDGATVVSQQLTMRYRGITRLFGPFLGGAVRAKLDADLERLRQGAETD